MFTALYDDLYPASALTEGVPDLHRLCVEEGLIIRALDDELPLLPAAASCFREA